MLCARHGASVGGEEKFFVEMCERTSSLRKHRFGRKNNINMGLQGIIW